MEEALGILNRFYRAQQQLSTMAFLPAARQQATPRSARRAGGAAPGTRGLLRCSTSACSGCARARPVGRDRTQWPCTPEREWWRARVRHPPRRKRTVQTPPESRRRSRRAEGTGSRRRRRWILAGAGDFVGGQGGRRCGGKFRPSLLLSPAADGVSSSGEFFIRCSSLGALSPSHARPSGSFSALT